MTEPLRSRSGTRRPLKILVCGAGIAGPTLAYWLRRWGFAPTLVERAPALRAAGYMVDFWGLGFDVAERMALLPALAAAGYAIEEVRFVDRSGRRVGGFDARAVCSVLDDRFLSIPRGDLARLVYDSLGSSVRTLFGDTVVSIEQDSEGVRVGFEKQAVERFDLVIGAGGLHSPVREIVFGPQERFEKYLGYYAASFTISDYPRRESGVYVSHAVPGRQVARYALRDGSTVCFFVFAASVKLAIGPHAVEAQKAALRERFAHDGWECRDMLAALDSCTDLYFDAVSQIRMPTWSRGRVALVGDSCFCPSLLAGQGASLAMAGAYLLASELHRHDGDHEAAFLSYEARLRPLIRRKQRGGERFAAAFAPRTRLGVLLRNRVSRLMSIPMVARLAMRGLLTDDIALPAYGAACSDAPALGDAAPRSPSSTNPTGH